MRKNASPLRVETDAGAKNQKRAFA